MIVDFFLQVFLAAVFFFGIAGVGILLLRVFHFQEGNIFFDTGVAYFVSLCFYTIGAVSALFLFPWKIPALQLFTILYIIVSFFVIFQIIPKKRDDFFRVARENKLPLIAGLFAVFFFFLQIYHTSILDEWLHRPIVKSFTENGVFPLVNPLEPHGGYIYTYHYGAQIVSSALQVITKIGVSESMDIFKLSYFVAAFVLFYGVLLKWIGKKKESALGAFLVLFAGGSFFLLDGFSVSHIWRLKWVESAWPLNTPPSFAMTGITGVNTVLAIGFAFFLEHIMRALRAIPFWKFLMLGVLFVGYFLLTEIFALLMLGLFVIFSGYNLFKQREGIIIWLRITALFFALAVVIFSGIYFSGGMVGHMEREWTQHYKNSIVNNNSAKQVIDAEHQTLPETKNSEVAAEKKVDTPSPSALSFRPPKEWGYPSEKRILTIMDYSLLYVRNFLLEILLLALLAYAFWKKKEELSKYPLLASSVAIGFLLPFFFSTSHGTLNFSKLTVLSLVILHLSGFAILFRMKLKKAILMLMLALFIFAAIPGALIGTNIQWKWLSSKGKEQYCSQNPRCYKGEFTDLLRKFEREYPGLKRIAVDSKNSRKVADLTNSYIYGYGDERAEYIVDTPEFRKRLPKKELEDVASTEALMTNGEYRVLKVR